MTGWEVLQEVGAFTFDHAIEEVESIFANASGYLVARPGIAEDLPLIYDLTFLGAAAFVAGVSEQIQEGPRESLEVGETECRVSFLKFACSMTNIHEPRSAQQIRLTDVVPFSGDVAKLRAAGASSVAELAKDFDAIFDRFLDSERSSPSPLTRAIAESGWLHLESLVWLTTALRLMDSDNIGGAIDDHVERYREYLGYLHPRDLR